MRKILVLLLGVSAVCISCQSKTVTDRNQVKSTVQTILPKVKDCYANELRQSNANIHGKLMTSFQVNDHGKVGSCTVKSSQLQNQKIESCVCQKISTTTFPPAPRGKMAVVDYPFVFSRE